MKRFNPLTRQIEDVKTFIAERGEQGSQGIQGVQGQRGEKGDLGPMGLRGFQGEQGIHGEQGPQGIKGDKGEQGLQGLTGPQGLQGVQGIKGDNGKQGQIGLKGENGKDGTEIYFVSRVPNNDLGNDGEWCFNSLKEVFYKQAGKWVFYSAIGGGNTRLRALEEIGNVKITSISTNQVLSWNGTTWVNRTVVGGSGSGITRTITSIAVNTAADATADTDYTYFITAVCTLTMPTAVSNLNEYNVKNTTSNQVFINFTGIETGEGDSTITLGAYESVTLHSDNTNWWVI